jgi:hypothetical protein
MKDNRMNRGGSFKKDIVMISPLGIFIVCHVHTPIREGYVLTNRRKLPAGEGIAVTCPKRHTAKAGSSNIFAWMCSCAYHPYLA